MRYEDASGTGSFNASEAAQSSTLSALNDADVVLAGSYAPATGNTITGTGTISGVAGADMIGAGASITGIQGAGGTDTSFSGGKLSIAGQYGVLTIDAQGNYSYARNQGSPNGVSDVFSYTLSGADGASDMATLTINIGKTPQAIQANAVQVVPGPDGVVTLPAGVELSDIHVVGRNLVIDLPDGSQMVIVDGAVFVPQLVLGTVEVPSSNLAALLINSEPTPAAGPPQSSGGNFAVPPPPLDPGVPLGDLIPPTELDYTPPEYEEPFPDFEEDDEPVLITDLTPSVSGGDVIVDEDDLSDGSDTTKESLTVAGTFTLIAPDGVDDLTVANVQVIINGVFQAGASMTTPLGNTLTFTGYNAATGVVTYTYTLLDNEQHPNANGENSLFEEFPVTLTDEDGDVDTDTLSVNVIDDVPTARPDTDTLNADLLTADGNVMTGAGTTNSASGADTEGADGAQVTGVHQGTTGGFTAVTGAGVTINGLHGTLTIFNDGSYEYNRNPESQDNVTEVFTYQLTDGDGDTSTATLTITIPNINEPPIVRGSTTSVSEEGLPNGNPDTDGTPDTTNDASVGGSIFIDDPDGDPVTVRLQVPNPDPGLTSGTDPIVWAVSPDGHTLTGTADGNLIVTVTINDLGAYEVVLSGPIDHPDDTIEDALSFTIPVTVDDGTAPPVPTTIVVTVEDDSPVADDPVEPNVPTLVVDESPIGEDEGGDNDPAGVRTDTASFAGLFGVVDFGADGPGTVEYGLVLSSEGAGSGLFALGVGGAQGAEIQLFTNPDGSISGMVGTDVYFTISVVESGAGAGDVTFEQFINVYHDDQTSDDDTSTLNAAPGTITLDQVVTDADGDTDSASVDISAGVFNIEDDGPVADDPVEPNVPTLVVDESPIGEDEGGDNDPAGVRTDTASFAGLFGVVDFGTDGPGTVEYGLVLSSEGAGSGLFALGVGGAQGAEIQLFTNPDGSISGMVGTDVYFTISVVESGAGAGDVTFEQFINVYHDDQTSDDDTSTLNAAPGTITLDQVVTDADGDTDSASVDISAGVFNIEDDGPVADDPVEPNVPTLVVDESPIGEDEGGDNDPAGVRTDTASFAGLFGVVDFGTDGPGTVEYGLVLSSEGAGSGLFALGVGGAQGAEIQLFTNPDGSISGMVGTDVYFTISVVESGAGAGDVTFEQFINVYHDDQTSDDDTSTLNAAPGTITLDQVVTDADGDTDSASVDISAGVFNIEDDGPDAFNEPQQDVPEGQTIAGTFDFDPGTDGATVTHINGVPLVFGVGGFSQWIVVVGGQIRAQADGSYVFEADASGSGVISGNFTVTDGDGDPDTATWAFNITDANSPTAGISEARLDDDGLTGPPAGNPASTTGDIDANVGEVAVVNPSEAIFHGLLTLSFGGDGPGTVTFAAMDGLPGTVGTETVLYSWAGSTLTATIDGGARDGTVLFDIVVNQTTGVYTLTLRDNVLHAVGGDDETSAPNVALTYTVTDSDNSPAGGVNGTLNIEFNDDAPTVTVNAEIEPTLEVDESDFTVNDGPTSFAGLFDVDFGADGPATTGALDFELNIDTGDTGLVDTLTGEDVILVKVGETIEGRTDTTNALVFVISVNADGEVSLDQQRSIIHPNPADPNESITFAADSLITLSLTATDGDGDSHTVGDPINIAQNFLFFDDGPTIDAANVTDPLEIENTGTPSGTGDFPFDVGADVNGDFNDISVDNFTIMINGVPATSVVLTEDVDALGAPSPETATTASYRFTFQYDIGASELANASGTLVFNKATGQYTVTLDSGPILGFSFLETGSDTTDFVEFDLNGGAPDVVTAQLADNLFAQFTAESTNNNGTPNLLTTGGLNTAWTPGELFTADPGNPQVSSTDAGVDGNTMDTGEVLDFNLYTSDPGSDTTGTPDGFAAEMFIQFFQATASDDIIVILKLANADDPSITTTRAIIIDGEDAFVQGDTATGTLYEGMVAALGSQEALVVIQYNDFNADGENWVIVGAQIVTDNDGTSGTGVDLDGDLGLAGASDRDGDGDFTTDSGNAALDELDTFAEDTDTSGIKITSIGFLVPSTTAQQAIIEFDVTITDGDDDTVTYEDVTVTIGDAPAPLAAMMTTQEATNDNSSMSLLSSDDQEQQVQHQLQKTAANTNTTVLAAAIAAAGMSAKAAARDAEDNNGSDNADADALTMVAPVEQSSVSGDDEASRSALTGETKEAADDGSSDASDSANAANDQPSGGHSLTAANDSEPVTQPVHLLEATEMSASNNAESIVAPTVSMPSAEALIAASLKGGESAGGKADPVVGQILVEALENGGAEQSIDALLEALPATANGGNAAVEALASQPGAAVSSWDSGHSGGFTAAANFTMEAMALHHDAVQPVANG